MTGINNVERRALVPGVFPELKPIIIPAAIPAAPPPQKPSRGEIDSLGIWIINAESIVNTGGTKTSVKNIKGRNLKGLKSLAAPVIMIAKLVLQCGQMLPEYFSGNGLSQYGQFI